MPQGIGCRIPATFGAIIAGGRWMPQGKHRRRAMDAAGNSSGQTSPEGDGCRSQ